MPDVTQRDLYDAIGGLRSEVKGWRDDMEPRVRGLEQFQASEEERHATRTRSGISARWWLAFIVTAAIAIGGVYVSASTP